MSVTVIVTVTESDLVAIVSRYDGVTDFINNATNAEKRIVFEGALAMVEAEQSE